MTEEFGNLTATAFTEEFLETPEAREALGEVVHAEMNLDEVAEEGDFEVRVKGSKASGTLIISYDDQGTSTAVLAMDDGRTIDLPTSEAFEPKPSKVEKITLPEPLPPVADPGDVDPGDADPGEVDSDSNAPVDREAGAGAAP